MNFPSMNVNYSLTGYILIYAFGVQSVGTLINVFKCCISKLLRLMDINKQLRITKRGRALVPFCQISMIQSV